MLQRAFQLSAKTITFFSLLYSVVCFGQLKEPMMNNIERNKLFQSHLDLKNNTAYIVNDTTKISDLKWQFLGPKNRSGRCVDVEVVENVNGSFTIYSAAASGGVWRSVNEGITWEPIFFDQGPAMSIGDIAVAPSDHNTIWIGTGEANIFRSSMAGNGIYKSVDGGETWQHMGLDNTNTIARIVIHPTNPDIVYVAASGHEYTFNEERGVYKTTDGGKTWENILYVEEKTGAIDLAMDPDDNETLYSSTWQRIRKKWNDPRNESDYDGSGIYKTVDGGKNWKAINNGLPEPKFIGRTGIDIAKSNTNVIYAYVDNYEIAESDGETDSYGREVKKKIKGATVYRSENKGENWKHVSGLTDEMKRYMESHSATYGWVFGQIKCDPNDENIIYTMGLSLNVSKDGGKSFKRVRGTGHSDHHGLWVNPKNSKHMVMVNDGGTAITYDQGENWRLLRDHFYVSQFFNVNYDMSTPFKVYGSMQDQGSARGIVDLSKGRDKIPTVDFESAPGGEDSHHAADPTDPNIVYSTGFYGQIYRSDYNKPSEYREYTSTNIFPKTSKNEPELRGQWMAPFIISPHNPNIVYHGMQYLFRSQYKGQTFEKISPDLSNNNPDRKGDIPFQTIFSISESPFQFGLIYVGTDDGNIHITKDGGKKWTKITDGIPEDRFVSRLVASEYDKATVYMTMNGKRDDDFQAYVYKSTDYGNTWKDISGNIPFGPVNVIREDPLKENILYVGTDLGVYVSKDYGKTWDVLGGNLPSVYVHDLVIHPRDNIIVIATHGRGIWVMDANPINKTFRNGRWR